MSSYWVNFARSGDPNGPGLPAWPAYRDAATGKAQVLGDTVATERHNRAGRGYTHFLRFCLSTTPEGRCQPMNTTTSTLVLAARRDRARAGRHRHCRTARGLPTDREPRRRARRLRARIAGKPDLNGVWQAIGTAYWNLEDHSADGAAGVLAARRDRRGSRRARASSKAARSRTCRPRSRSATRIAPAGRRPIPKPSATCPAFRARPTCRSPSASCRATATSCSSTSSRARTASCTCRITRSRPSTAGWAGRTAAGKATRS